MNPEELHKETENLLTGMFSMYKTRFLYARSHPRFMECQTPTLETLSRLLEELPEILILIVEHEFIFLREPLFRGMPLMRQFADIFHAHGIERIVITRGVVPDEVSSVVEILMMKIKEVEAEGGYEAAIRKRNITHVFLESIATSDELLEVAGSALGNLASYTFLPTFARMPFSRLREDTCSFFGEAKEKITQESLEIFQENVTAAIEGLQDAFDCLLDAFHGHRMNFGERDHDINCCLLTVAFTFWLGLDRESVRDLGIAALLHDMGKLRLPPQIQNKPPILMTADELDLYRQHPQRGAEQILSVKDAPRLAAIVAWEHHVGADGSGFPSLSEDRQPHEASLIVSLVNRYENAVRFSSDETAPREYLKTIQNLRDKEIPARLFDLFSAWVAS